MTPRVAVIGLGGIGTALVKRITDEKHWDIAFAGSRSTYPRSHNPVDDILSELKQADPDLTFLCMSSQDKGKAALAYTTACVRVGKKVVTCEKGMLANFAEECVEEMLPFIGYSAAVGGGTHMLPYLQARRPNSHSMYIEAVINGSLNRSFQRVASGEVTFAGAFAEAKALKIAEPDCKDEMDFINGECADLLNKTCVVANTSLIRDSFITPNHLIGGLYYTDEQIVELTAKAAEYRFVVTFTNRKEFTPHEYFGPHFRVSVEDWEIEGGAREIKSVHWRLPDDVDNALCIVEGNAFGSGGRYVLYGPGAGVEQTTTAMLNDAERLLRI